MKDSLNIDPIIKEIDRPQIVRMVQHEYKLFGKMRYKEGVKLFAMNIETGEINEAEIIKKAILNVDGEVKYSRRINYDPKCIYRPAINRKNAVRKFRNLLNNL